MDVAVEPYHQMTYTLIGINYRQADVAYRSFFYLNPEQIQELYVQAKSASLSDLYILSTCNRTELYALCQSPTDLLALLFSVLPCEYRANFEKNGYMKRGQEAVLHLFRVTSGLDSQILGDYEIVGQVKTAFQQAKTMGAQYSAFGERVLNTALEAAKRVRSNTHISEGTVSVSMAAVQSIVKQYPENYREKQVLLIGFGDIARNTYIYLREFGVPNIRIANRSPEKITATYPELHGYSLSELPELCSSSDIIISATAANEYLIKAELLFKKGHYLLIDLGLPANIDPKLAEEEDIILKNLDEISRILDATKQKRAEEVPKAEKILQAILQELLVWIHERKQMALLKGIKNRLLSLDEQILRQGSEKIAQEHINELARCFRKHQDFKGCSVIATYQKYLYGRE